MPDSLPECFLCYSYIRSVGYYATAKFEWSRERLITSLPPLKLLATQIATIQGSLLAGEVFRSSDPTLGLVSPLLVTAILLKTPSMLATATLVVSNTVL